MAAKTGSLSINSENIFPIIKKWLYSDHDIFYRELISNGCDAITKLKKLVKLELKAEKGAFRLNGRSAIFSASLQTISKYAIVASIHKAICQPDSGIWQRRRNGKILNRKIKNKEEE